MSLCQILYFVILFIDLIIIYFQSCGPFHMQEYDAEDVVVPLVPSLNCTAPELVYNKMSNVNCSSDLFSLECLAYHLIARRPLLDCNNNARTVLLLNLTQDFASWIKINAICFGISRFNASILFYFKKILSLSHQQSTNVQRSGSWFVGLGNVVILCLSHQIFSL